MNGTANIPLPSAAYLSNCRWIETQLKQLVPQYADKWIAVDQARVLAAGPNLGQVTQAARRASSSSDVVYEFIAGGSMIF